MKKFKSILPFLIFILFTINAGAQQWSQKMSETAMNLWADSFALREGQPARWSYDQGVILKGIEGVWKATADKKYYDYIKKSMDFFVQEDGTIKGYSPDEFNIDHINNGKLLLFLYKVTLQEKYKKAADLLRKQLQHHPRTAEGGFWHKQIYTNQMWLDGLYMGQPFYAEYAQLFHEDTAFFDIAKQFILMEQHARDTNTGLLYHGYDESKQQQWADKTTGRSPNVWGRAMGWYGMALVDVLEWFPQDHPQHSSLVGILNRLATTIEKYQDAKTGLWWDVIDKPGSNKNYFEASASSMFVYTLAKGARLHLLSQKFVPVAKKGYEGIIKEFIKTENGQVNLHGTVSVSGLGGKPYRDGSFEYYMSEKVIVNDPKGIGAFIKASNEIEMLPTLKKGWGKTVLLDQYFNNELKKDITGTTVQHHYIWSQQDQNGYSLLGQVFNKYGVQTKSLYGAPTEVNLKGADIYFIVDPDTEKETAVPNYLQPYQIDAIYNWVKEGGVLMLFGNDSGNVEFTHFNQLANRFGMHFNYDSKNKVTGSAYEKGTFTIPPNHPVFKSSKKIYIKEYASQTLSSPATAVFKDGNTVVMSMAKIGKGTVFAVGDPWFYNEYFDGRKLPAELENYKAGEDLVQWIIEQTKKKDSPVVTKK